MLVKIYPICPKFSLIKFPFFFVAAHEIYELEIKIGENTGSADLLGMVAVFQGGHNNREKTEPLYIQGWPWPSDARNMYTVGTSQKFGSIHHLTLRSEHQKYTESVYVEEVRSRNERHS